jgi:hypothetical protein
MLATMPARTDTKRLMDLMVKWHYEPHRRFSTKAATEPATDNQYGFISVLGYRHADKLDELTELIRLAWGLEPNEWTKADAQYIIKTLRGK